MGAGQAGNEGRGALDRSHGQLCMDCVFLLSYVFDYWLCVTTCGMRNISNRYQILIGVGELFISCGFFLVRFPAIASFIVHNNLFLDNHIAI